MNPTLAAQLFILGILLLAGYAVLTGSGYGGSVPTQHGRCEGCEPSDGDHCICGTDWPCPESRKES
jgi:hypothetical protein